jgi:hypothetical protein
MNIRLRLRRVSRRQGEAIRRGVRTIGTGHLILALLIEPASPTVDPASRAAEALGGDLGAACRS